MSDHTYAHNYDREELREINECLDFWKRLEHGGWVVSAFSSKISCTYVNHDGGWDGNGSPCAPVTTPIYVSISQVDFFRGAFNALKL